MSVVDAEAWQHAIDEARALSLGTEAAANAIDGAIETLKRKYGDTILIGGPPCQAYALLGRVRSRGKVGYVPEEDARQYLFCEYIRVLYKLRPAADEPASRRLGRPRQGLFLDIGRAFRFPLGSVFRHKRAMAGLIKVGCTTERGGHMHIRTGLVVVGIALTGWSAAAQEGSITVYTAHAPEIYQAIVPRFESETGISVEIVQAGSGDIIQRTRAEAGAPIADVIWSIGGEALEANSDLLAPYEPAEMDALNELYLGGTNWLPYTAIPMAFIVNTDLVEEGEEPTSWADLADEKWQGRVAFAGADGSGSAFIQMATVIHIYGEDEGWDLFERMMDNFIVTGSSGAVPRGTADGEYAVGLTLEEAAYRYVAGGAPVKITYPEDGNYAGADGVALVANGPNSEGGQAFIDFVLSAEIQEFLVEEMMRRPVRTDVADPEGLMPLEEMNIDNYEIAWAGENRDEMIRRYLSILRR